MSSDRRRTTMPAKSLHWAREKGIAWWDLTTGVYLLKSGSIPILTIRRMRMILFALRMISAGSFSTCHSQKNFILIGLVSTLRSEEHTSELQSRGHLVCRLLLEIQQT